MTSSTVPDVNLAPSAATGVRTGQAPPKVGALTAEHARGTEMASFRLPLTVKALVSRIVNDPRFGYNGTLSHFYLEAIGYSLFYHEQYFRGDKQFSGWSEALRRLDMALILEEPIEAFRARLEIAEKKAGQFIQRKSLDTGRQLLAEAVHFVMGAEEPLHTALTSMLQESKPMQALCHMLVEDEEYGLTDEVDRLQKFMGNSL